MKEFIRRNGILISISVIAILVIVSVIFSYTGKYTMAKNRELIAETESVKLIVNNILSDNLQALDQSLRAYALTKSETHLKWYEDAKRYKPNKIKDIRGMLENQKIKIPGGIATIDTLLLYLDDIDKKLDGYYTFCDSLVILINLDSTATFKKLLEADKGMVPWSAWDKLNKKTSEFESKINREAQNQYALSISMNSWVQFLLFFIGLPTLALIVITMRRDDKKRKNLLIDLDTNNRKYLFNNGIKSTTFDPKELLEGSIENFKKAAGFIKKIAEGNYEVQWDGLTKDNTQLNQENLAGELVKMREQMKKIKTDDDRRNWTNEGLSQLGDVLRKYNEIDKLADVILSSLIKYLGANQGMLFVLNDDDESHVFMEIRSTYAYDKKKFIQKEIPLGEGLVGQAWQEGDTIYLTDIPQGYNEITSGMGGANPNNLLIVPLKNDKAIYGILEIASFKVFAPHEIAFVEKITESIAVTIGNAKISEKTKILLAQSQELAESMKSQEEELRQNMEELESTQEEMKRKEEQYLNEIRELKSEMSRI